MSDLSERIARMREQWVDVRPGKRVKLRRPAELALSKLTAGVEIENISAATVDWEGWTEADFLGGAVGKSDVIDFDREAWHEYLMDHAEEAGVVAKALVELIQAHFEKREAAAKNS